METLHLLNIQYEFPSHLKTNQLVSSRALFAQALQQLQSSKPVNVNYHYESNWEGSLAPCKAQSQSMTMFCDGTPEDQAYFLFF